MRETWGHEEAGHGAFAFFLSYANPLLSLTPPKKKECV